jgi:DNA-binding NtrC family response regulator
MSLGDLSKLDKIMLVSSEACDEVEKCLLSAGCGVVKLNSGEAAISRAQRENFDAAVLVSTGKAMDLAETVLNLRDVNGSMQIVVVTERDIIKNDILAKALVAHPVPRTQVLTVAQLESQFMPLRTSERQDKRRVTR